MFIWRLDVHTENCLKIETFSNLKQTNFVLMISKGFSIHTQNLRLGLFLNQYRVVGNYGDELLKEVIQKNLWKTHGKDPRISRFLGVASDLSVVGEIILFKDKVIPPLNSRSRFVEKAHKIGHSGENRTLKLLQEKIWFPGIARLCKETARNCQSCQATHDRTYDEPLQSTPLASGPWHTISVDVKGPFKDGNYALIGYDLYSRYPVVDYCRSTAFSCVKPILDSWFSTFGTVKELKSDRGPPFNGHERKDSFTNQ